MPFVNGGESKIELESSLGNLHVEWDPFRIGEAMLVCGDVIPVVFCPGHSFSQSKLISSVGVVHVVCELVSTLVFEPLSIGEAV